MIPIDLEIQYKDIRQTKTPALSYCRKLVKEGFPEGSRLFVYRGEVLALKLDIHKAAKLTIQEDKDVGPIFVKYAPYTGTSTPPIDYSIPSATYVA